MGLVERTKVQVNTLKRINVLVNTMKRTKEQVMEAVKWTHRRGECGPHCGMTGSPRAWPCGSSNSSSGG